MPEPELARRDVAPRDRLVRVEHVMGTAVSLTVRRDEVGPDAVDGFFAWLREVDARFSTYRDDSEVSRMRRGEVTPAAASRDLVEVLALCEEVGRVSAGAFDAWRCSPDGVDPSGLVKGWSVERGAAALVEAGVRNLCVNAGGDVLTRGEAEPGRAWRVGIRHPEQPSAVAAVIAVRDLAVATSATYERGAHIVDPHRRGTMAEVRSITVVGPSLTLADAYATASFVMGRDGLGWVAARPGYDAYAVTAEGRAVWTDGFDALLVRPPRGEESDPGR